jgi:hypothetical protein
MAGNLKPSNGLEKLGSLQLAPVCTEKLNPGIVVIQSAEDGERFDVSGPLNRAETGASLSNDRCVLMSL